MSSPSTPRIRSATPEDARSLAGLRYEFRAGLDPAAESPEKFVARCESWMRDNLGAASDWRCWVVEAEGRAIGMAWVMIIEKLPNPVGEPERHGYVSSLYLKPEFRGHGLGSELLATCLRSCEALRCDAIFLWPSARSRSLYLRHGFSVREDLLQRRIVPTPAHA